MKLTVKCGPNTELVKGALRQLLYYRAIIMVDLFQYSNRYACTKEISRLLPVAAGESSGKSKNVPGSSSAKTTNSEVDAFNPNSLQAECRRYVAARPDAKLPSFSKIFAVYASLHPRAPFGDFVLDFDFEGLGIDPHRFVNFGLRLGILERKKLVPFLISTPLNSNGGATAMTTTTTTKNRRGEGVSPLSSIRFITVFFCFQMN